MPEFMYITVFMDGAIKVWRRKPKMKDFQAGTRLFKVPDNMPISHLIAWSAYNFEETVLFEELSRSANWE